MNRVLMNRRHFLHAGALTLGAMALSTLTKFTKTKAALSPDFLLGVNYPWVAYGHDFGANGWGHDGIMTSGWTYQTWPDSQGFIDTRFSTERSKSGVSSLAIQVDLQGQHPNKSQGEVYIDLTNHSPTEVETPLNLTNVDVTCWVWLPAGSSGVSNAPNGIQIFFKSNGQYSYYSEWRNISPTQEETWVQFSANPSDPNGQQDAQFDPTNVTAVGLKMGVGGSSTATLTDPIFLDDFVIHTDPALTFDFEQLEVEKDFEAFPPQIGVARVFLFADGRAAPEFDGTGNVTGFDEYVYQDFDTLLDIAEQKNIKLMPVLLDFWWCNTAEFVNGVQQGGYANVIRDTSKRDDFLDLVLKPLVERYSNHAQIWGWDIINEPEWAMQEVPESFKMADAVTVQEMQDFVQLCANTIHTYSPDHLVTVGCARRKYLGYWKNLDLDVYQFHWYDHHIADEPFPWEPYDELELDKPCIIGEVPTANTAFLLCEFIAAAHQGGYSGLLAWSFRAKDEASDWPTAIKSLNCTYLPYVRG